MNPPIKKLISIFLLAAVVASSLTLGISTFIDRSSGSATATELAARGAFDAATPYDTTRTEYGAGPGGQNLTDTVAGMFARELMQTNPQGPQATAEGLIGLLMPTSTEVEAYLSANPPSTATLTPPVDDSRIQVVEHPQAKDLSEYFAAVTSIQSRVASDPLWQNAIAASSTPSEWMDPSRSSITIARDDLYGVKVPSLFKEFHKSLIALLSTTAAYSQVAANDPVAAVALTQELNRTLDRQTLSLETAVQQFQSDPEIFGVAPGAEAGVIASLFSIPTAHATVVTIDPAHIGTTIAQWARWFADNYKRIAMSIALGYLKNTLLEKLAQKIIEWVEGEGAPGYVTNWLRHRIDASIRGATNLIAKNVGALCANNASGGVYGSVIASALGYPRRGPSNFAQPAGTTFQNSRNCRFLTPEDLAGKKPFQWDRFIGSLEVNPWHDLMTLGDQAMDAADQAAAAAINEATAGSGFVDSKKYYCDDGSAVDNELTCADGSDARSETITLGSNKKDIVSATRTSSFDFLTALNNEELYTTVGVYILKRLVEYDKDKGILGNSSGGGGGDNTPPPSGDTMQALLAQYASALEGAKANVEGAKSATQNTIRILEFALPSCGENNAAQIQTRISDQNGILAQLDTRLQNIERLLGIVQQFRQDPTAHTIAELESQVGSPESIATIANDARAANTAAETAATSAQQFIQGCSTTT